MNGGWLKEGAVEFSDRNKTSKTQFWERWEHGSRRRWDEGVALGLCFRDTEPNLEHTLLQKSTCRGFCETEAGDREQQGRGWVIDQVPQILAILTEI